MIKDAGNYKAFARKWEKLELFECEGDGGCVAFNTQSADHADSNAGQIGMVAKCFALMNIRDVHFNKGDSYTSQCVAQ